MDVSLSGSDAKSISTPRVAHAPRYSGNQSPHFLITAESFSLSVDASIEHQDRWCVRWHELFVNIPVPVGHGALFRRREPCASDDGPRAGLRSPANTVAGAHTERQTLSAGTQGKASGFLHHCVVVPPVQAFRGIRATGAAGGI